MKLTSNLNSIELVRNKYLSHEKKLNTLQENDFNSLLLNKSTEIEEVKFSKHANQRLNSRNISLSKEQLERLSQSMNRARQKGINDSLILLDELAFIVNTKNNTVVTAVGDSEDKIFTNIDGAVIG